MTDMRVHCGSLGTIEGLRISCYEQAGHDGDHQARLYQRRDGSWSDIGTRISWDDPQPSREVSWPANGPEHYTTEALITRALISFAGLIDE